MNKIQKQHFALIIKYTGISFITGWLSHWFFTWERQILTSLIGIVFFIVWTLLEQNIDKKDYMKTILFSALLAVSIWAFTWGLQHFPDSPSRSAWIVPLWFLLSVYSYLSLENISIFKKKNLIYLAIWFIVSILISAIWYYIIAHGLVWAIWWHSH